MEQEITDQIMGKINAYYPCLFTEKTQEQTDRKKIILKTTLLHTLQDYFKTKLYDIWSFIDIKNLTMELSDNIDEPIPFDQDDLQLVFDRVIANHSAEDSLRSTIEYEILSLHSEKKAENLAA